MEVQISDVTLLRSHSSAGGHQACDRTQVALTPKPRCPPYSDIPKKDHTEQQQLWAFTIRGGSPMHTTPPSPSLSQHFSTDFLSYLFVYMFIINLSMKVGSCLLLTVTPPALNRLGT